MTLIAKRDRIRQQNFIEFENILTKQFKFTSLKYSINNKSDDYIYFSCNNLNDITNLPHSKLLDKIYIEDCDLKLRAKTTDEEKYLYYKLKNELTNHIKTFQNELLIRAKKLYNIHLNDL